MTTLVRPAGARALLAVGVAVLIVALTSSGAAAKPKPPTIATAPFSTPTGVTLADAPPPWPLPTDARRYIDAAGLDVLSEEQLQVHYHAHLDIIANGKKVTVPAGIGFVVKDGNATGITVLHTHDRSGVLHVESAAHKAYTLGQVFTEWGVALSATQLGGLHADRGDVLHAYVNGRRFTGDPATIRLERHLEIALWYGHARTTPKVPKSYRFPAGL